MKLGAHLSISGGIYKAVEQAKEIKASTLQIFSGSPRSWETKDIKILDIKIFRELAERYKIAPIFIHSKYLVNLASENKTIQEKSINSLIFDLKLARKIKAKGVIFHPRPKNFVLLIKNIKLVLTKTPKSTFLILENSAQMKLESIGKIIKSVKNKRLKFCFDLAHAFQASYNLKTSQGIQKVITIIKKNIGLNHWVVIHANDSKTACGSKNDKHEDIGKGQLGPVPFFIFLNHPQSCKLPFILETPGFKEKGLKGDKKNLEMLRKLVGRRLDKKFFRQPTLSVARQLLGKYLIVKRKGKFQIGQITETEAYVGPHDKASHASRGKTQRNKTMWDSPGKLYVYLIYGIYHCLNIVTEKKGFPAAVLIRGLKPVFEIGSKTDGPGKLCRELGISQKDTGIDITESRQIYIKDISLPAHWRGEKSQIKAAPRIGVDYAGEWAYKKWRFVVR